MKKYFGKIFLVIVMIACTIATLVISSMAEEKDITYKLYQLS